MTSSDVGYLCILFLLLVDSIRTITIRAVSGAVSQFAKSIRPRRIKFNLFGQADRQAEADSQSIL